MTFTRAAIPRTFTTDALTRSARVGKGNDQQMQIIDITQELFHCAVFPGDPVPEMTRSLSLERGDVCNLTAFSMCAHNGTHVDAPFHFIDGGKTVDRMGLVPYVGDCWVARHSGDVTVNDARRMLEYGYGNYQLTVGERLGNPGQERIREFTLSEAAQEASWSHPCCIILQKTEPRPRPFGIPDAAFDLLNGRQNMITKAPLRLLTLSALDLHRRTCLWDIGFCTGSVSIEARLQFPHLQVEAFEVRPEGEQLMQANSRRFGAPGIGVHIGDFLSQDLGALPRPDAVFIGGHGGRLAEVVERAGRYLLPGGVIVFNSVSQESASLFRQAVGTCEELYVTLEGHHPIRIMKKNYG